MGWIGSDIAAVVWCRTAAIARIQALAWEFPCVVGAALKGQKKKKILITMDKGIQQILSLKQILK